MKLLNTRNPFAILEFGQLRRSIACVWLNTTDELTNFAFVSHVDKANKIHGWMG
jgi:hypothetical protein